MNSIDLRPYQSAALDAIEKAEQKGTRRQVLVLATGLGKTICFADLIRRRGGRALVLAHRDELLDQAAQKIRAVIPEVWIGRIQGKQNDRAAHVVVASVQTVSQPKRLERLSRSFQTVVVDEAHHAPSSSYRRVLEHLRCFEKDGPLLLGVTATPMRGDKIALGHVFDEIVFEMGILEGIAGGWLSDLRAKRIKIEVDFKALRSSHGDFVQSQAGDMLRDAGAPEHIAEAWVEYAHERKGIVFTPTIEVAELCAAALREKGVAAESLSGQTPTDQRRAILRRLKDGMTRVVANCAVLTEGFDEPSVDCIVMARPTKSQTLYLQCIGRGTRRWPGKTECLVLDVVGVTERNELCTINSLLGRSLGGLKVSQGGTVLEALAEQQELGVQTKVDGRMVVVDVDILRGNTSQWVSAGKGAFALSVGNDAGGMLLIRPLGSDGQVRISYLEKGQEKVLRTAPSMDIGIGIAEGMIRRSRDRKVHEHAQIARPDAPWRKKPVTAYPRIMAQLEKWKIPIRPGLTAGEASDLISAALARIRLRAARRAAGGAA